MNRAEPLTLATTVDLPVCAGVVLPDVDVRITAEVDEPALRPLRSWPGDPGHAATYKVVQVEACLWPLDGAGGSAWTVIEPSDGPVAAAIHEAALAAFHSEGVRAAA